MNARLGFGAARSPWLVLFGCCAAACTGGEKAGRDAGTPAGSPGTVDGGAGGRVGAGGSGVGPQAGSSIDAAGRGGTMAPTSADGGMSPAGLGGRTTTGAGEAGVSGVMGGMPAGLGGHAPGNGGGGGGGGGGGSGSGSGSGGGGLGPLGSGGEAGEAAGGTSFDEAASNYCARQCAARRPLACGGEVTANCEAQCRLDTDALVNYCPGEMTAFVNCMADHPEAEVPHCEGSRYAYDAQSLGSCNAPYVATQTCLEG